MRHSEGRLAGTTGVELYRQDWHPDEAAKAAIVLVHGVCEHSGRYGNLVAPLVGAGYAVYSYDQRGHGRSQGPRVHVDRWSEYRDDLEGFLGHVADEEPGLPLFLYGHSMGSLVVLDFLIERPGRVAGAIVSGVALEPGGVSKPHLIALARLLTGIVPRMSVDLGINPTQLTRDPAAVSACLKDDLMTSKATVRWGTESMDTLKRIRARMGQIDLPVLIVHGEADAVNLVSGARELHDALPNGDKTLRVYPEGHHEPHNDLEHEQLAKDVTAWLDARVNPSALPSGAEKLAAGD